jgi:hypothetical protein
MFLHMYLCYIQRQSIHSLYKSSMGQYDSQFFSFSFQTFQPDGTIYGFSNMAD